MKKSLIALAIFGAFAGAASAQSNVTLYGIVDAGLQYNKSGTGPSKFGVDGGYQSGNRWGLRGSESLGNGVSAIFTLESGFNIDTGTMGQDGRLFGRQAWAGLSTGAGSVVFGRIATFSSGTGSFDMFGGVDPFGTGWGINSLGSTFISAGALRVDNTVAYVTPTWGGFKGGAAYSFNANGAEAAGSSNNTRALALGANYAIGPFFAAITYDSVAYSDLAPTNGGPDQKHLQIGATWDFNFFKLYGAYAHQSNIRNLINPIGGVVVPTGLPTFDNNAYMIGATVPLFGGTLRGSWQLSDPDSYVVGTTRFEPKYDVFGIGYDYNFSKRTNVYAGYGQRSAKGSLPDAFKREQFALGLRHQF